MNNLVIIPGIYRLLCYLDLKHVKRKLKAEIYQSNASSNQPRMIIFYLLLIFIL